ncbi:MAG: hypothetical protein ACFB4I_08835 [Cyanophyceae cyanobacterium]
MTRSRSETPDSLFLVAYRLRPVPPDGRHSAERSVRVSVSAGEGKQLFPLGLRLRHLTLMDG